LYANYSLHYVGGVPGEMLSADYFGAFAEAVAGLVGASDAPPKDGETAAPPFVGILSNGTSADVNNVDWFNGVKPKMPFEQIRLVAQSVAASAAAAYKRIDFRDDVTLAAAREEIKLGVRKPTSEELERAKGILEKAKGREPGGIDEIYARETMMMNDFPDQVPLWIQTLRVGELGVAAIPCEVFVEIGLAVRETSPLKPAFTVSLANGYNGYLPTVRQHGLGGYETWRAKSSYLEVDAEPKIRATIDRLFHKIAP
ncbi:MAG: hypothetical protein ACRC1K_22070, partial [Planctomycetia bacterium]